MPSWNIHTAHVERLLAGRSADGLGIDDTNAFLFGNYVPDIYVGFMVPDTTYRLDYCLTHLANVSTIPVPDSELFWDLYINRRTPTTSGGMSLALGAWAHIVADQVYNSRFRAFCETHEVPTGVELRKRKQGDFDRFGRSLGISSRVRVTPELLEAAYGFHAYRLLREDVERSVAVADAIVEGSAPPRSGGTYQLLSAEWMRTTFEECDGRLFAWLAAWRRLVSRGCKTSAADVRTELGLH